jgi:hypothetical protein
VKSKRLCSNHKLLMDISRILSELYQERDNLDMAIASLERIQSGLGPRRGRPPAWLKEARRKAEAESEPESPARISRAGA